MRSFAGMRQGDHFRIGVHIPTMAIDAAPVSVDARFTPPAQETAAKGNRQCHGSSFG